MLVRNVGALDRALRVFGAIALGACALVAPFPLPIAAPAFGIPAAYLLFTSVAGTCFGYRLMGRSTCPAGGAER